MSKKGNAVRKVNRQIVGGRVNIKFATKEITKVLHDSGDQTIIQVRKGSSKHELRGLARMKHRPNKRFTS